MFAFRREPVFAQTDGSLGNQIAEVKFIVHVSIRPLREGRAFVRFWSNVFSGYGREWGWKNERPKVDRGRDR